uniref:Uncharacterized protein n=1 Tax=Metarhizium album TaxID=92629 RepID=A0A891GWT1_9HYPO|nr:hypothetical protein K8J96_mgp40 [Metarhizium album]QRK27464.1 hypothetical protein [Metarhizium album]
MIDVRIILKVFELMFEAVFLLKKDMFCIFNISIFVFCFLFTFLICWSRLYLYIGSSYIYRFMVTPTWFLNILFFMVFYIILYLFVSDDQMSIFDLADKNNSNFNVGENATVNITDAKVTIPINHLNRTAAAISMGAGVSAGIQAAKYAGGSPIAKLAAAGLAVGAVQLGTVGMSKILRDTDTKNSSSKLVANLVEGGSLNDYPLNLLYEVNGLLICALAFIYIIFNIYISKYIISKDFVKYIPPSIKNHKIGKFLVFWLNKYLNLWSKNSNYFLGFCYLMLLFCIVMTKLFLFIILS